MKGLCTHSLGGIGIVYPPDREAGSENWERERESVHKSYFGALSISILPSSPPFCLYQPPSLSAEGDAWWLLWSYLSRVKFLVRSNASGPRPSERRAGIIKQPSVFFTFYTSSPLLCLRLSCFFFSVLCRVLLVGCCTTACALYSRFVTGGFHYLQAPRLC